MNRTSFRQCALVLVLCGLGAPTLARAQSDGSLSGERALQRAIDTYRDALSYRDQVEVIFVTKIPSIDQDLETVARFGTHFEAPGSYAIVDFDGQSIYGDPQHVTAHMQLAAEYAVTPRDPNAEWTSQAGFVGHYLPIVATPLDIILSGARSLEAVTMIRSVGAGGRENGGDVEIDIVIDASKLGLDAEMDAVLRIDGQTHLIRELHVDLEDWTRRINDLAPEAQIEIAEMVVRYSDLKVNEPISAQALTFQPRGHDVRVKQLATTFGPADIIGKPAPAIRSTTLAGGTFDLESMRGRVVVLEFWASWCGACMRSMPIAEEIARTMESEPVAFVGINMDIPDAQPRAREVLGRYEIEAPQVLDPDHLISDAYGVLGTPLFVMIDREGVVQMARSSALDGWQEQFESALATLIEGGSLVD